MADNPVLATIAGTAGASRTIVALSSGRPPSGVAVVRISGPDAPALTNAFTGAPLPARRASLRTIRSPRDGAILDRALCLFFEAGASATGEAVLELHLHGSPALVERVIEDAINTPGVRLAEPGEFTMRAVLSGQMDLPAAEALAELIDARTEGERRRATKLAGGALARFAADWRAELIAALALVEAALDFADEGDVLVDGRAANPGIATLRDTISNVLRKSEGAERLTDGLHVVVAGPPNAGKSSLVNALAGSEAAIVSEEAGTTRDVISVPLVLGDYRVTLHDTAGVREGATGVEAIGIARTHAQISTADLVLEVQSPDTTPLRIEGATVVHHKSDIGAAATSAAAKGAVATSCNDPASIEALRNHLAALAVDRLGASEAAIITRARQRTAVRAAVTHLDDAHRADALEIKAEALRSAARALAQLVGDIGIEDVLDDVFSRFCIGK